MDRRFAVSENEALMLPVDFSFPVEFESYIQAKEEFSKCENRMACICKNLKAPGGYKSPLDSIRNLRKEITNVLPIKTSFREIKLARRIATSDGYIADVPRRPGLIEQRDYAKVGDSKKINFCLPFITDDLS
ncbi:hypothetical protein RB195_023630 [Necator americanus]|uniref:Uncharacterized protein n=1 Tax=Necator americanus TaxID=51031 RepID=A0ABR1EJZ6_NECAM